MSNTACGIYKLDGEVPETIMSGETSNISQFCELKWFEWVMFQDKTVPYPNDHFRLGRYLSLIIDIGPALMAEIIKENGQVIHRSTYQAQTQDEWEWEEWKTECSLFTESLHQRLDPHAEVRDLVKLGVEDTPQYNPYENELQNGETFPILDEEPEVTPKGGGPMCKHWNVTPKREQNRQRLCGMLEAWCQWYPHW